MRKAFLIFILVAIVVAPMAGRSSAAGLFEGGDKEPDWPEKNPARWSPGRVDRPQPLFEGGAESMAAPATSDRFGYSLQTSQPFNWVDASIGTQVSFGNSDDSSFGPVEIGFLFPYYENTYSELFVSTNGLLTFGEESTELNNKSIPLDSPPDDFIAPFWDDLVVGSFNQGKVYYLGGGVAPNRYFVVEWYRVTRFGSNDLLTFEAILYENGDIVLQYLELNGVLDEATVGIEDGDGVDGLLYLYNSSGLLPNKAVRFGRPPDGPRVKAAPIYQSSLVINRFARYSLQIKNIGAAGEDVYDLSAETGDPGWEVFFYRADGKTSLEDSDGDSVVDTGVLDQGTALTLTVMVRAPMSAPVGQGVSINLSAASTQDPSKKAEVLIQAAIPTSFAQAFEDTQLGMSLDLISAHKRSVAQTTGVFSGSTLALTITPDGAYVYVWEKSGMIFEPPYSFLPYSDIEFTLLDREGVTLVPVTKLTANQTLLPPINDRSPALAVASDDRIGLVWLRDEYDYQDSVLKTRSNIYFAALDPSGSLEAGPINLTGNAAWRGEDDFDIPAFKSPRVLATADRQFMISWVDGREHLAGETSDLGYAIVGSSGELIRAADILVQSDPGGERYLDPDLTGLADGSVLVAYSVLDPTDTDYTIAYQVLDRAGDPVLDAVRVPGGSGWGPAAVQFSGGNLLLVWADPTNGGITFCLLDGQSLLPMTGLQALQNPDNRMADFISVTRDSGDRAILTWMDAEWNHRLYYMLVDGSGNLLTAPMIFRYGEADEPLVLTSFAGQGSAAYQADYQAYLPIAVR